MYTNYSKGFSLIELLIVIAIISVLSAVMIPTLASFRGQQALKNTTEDLVSLLNTARSDTQGSLNSTNYSVYIDSSSATYFVGSVYISNAPTNKKILYNSAVTIPISGGVNLNGGGNIVSFSRLSGDTINYGTIVIQLSSDANRSKTITINKTGTVSSN
jgi:prepilin-type N-terminal cleavage/methylation domain-containing protein